jgi:hypothetical protein
MSKSIIWLASYPKSGNTWLRLFLFNYLFNLDEPAPINQAHRIGPSDASAALYTKISRKEINVSDAKQVVRLRPAVIDAHASNGADVNFMKTHSANVDIAGQALIPLKNSRGAIYIIRNPVDMAVSFAHHFGRSDEEVVASLNSDIHSVLGDKAKSVVPQFLGTWSGHVRSWVDDRKMRTHVLRYEDMHADPVTAFGDVLRYIGAPEDRERLERAIRFASFKEVKQQEEVHGFVEKPKDADSFFRSGKVGEGREKLAPALVDRIEADHGAIMKRFGYL